jgi:ABC-2 type transport system ATP-binding protein
MSLERLYELLPKRPIVNEQSPVVETVELTKRFGEFTALDGLSISIGNGQILGFIGPNGAGKTTTIRILVGLLRPSSGVARIAGVDCTREPRKLKRMVGYMPDKFGPYDNMRVSEYLDFFGAAFAIPRAERIRRIDEVLDITGGRNMRDLYVEALSHGMQQRVGIARTLLHDPQVLILDEPASGLDPHARIEMRELLLRLADAGKTLMVTSHILPELSRVCSVLAIITEGRLRAFGTLKEIMQRLDQRRTFEIQLVDAESLSPVQSMVEQSLSGDPDSPVSGSPAEAIVRFETHRTDEQLAGLLTQLVDRGFTIAQFREVPTDLEDAFLSVTRTETPTGSGAAEGRPAEVP